MKKTIVLFLVVAFTNAYGQVATDERATEKMQEQVLSETERAFLNNLASLCGKSFSGNETFMQPGRESWADKKFVMHVTICEHDRVHIPFHLDEDRSRTWMFLVEDGKLRFRHDHRHEDGTPEDQTLYGGYSDGTGTAFIQRFPADEYTIKLLNDTFGRQWNIILAEDLSTMEYQLLYHGEVVFSAAFDLTKPL
jgi:hypothetical protein